MANFTCYEGTDLLNFNWDYGLPTQLSDLTRKAIKLADSDTKAPDKVAILNGAFNYGSFLPDGATVGDKIGVISGTWTGYDYYEDQVIRLKISGLAFDVVTALIYMELAQTDPAYGRELMSLLLAGNDVIQGSAFNDTLQGLDGNDIINGGARLDTLYGGAGADTLTGGLGKDVFAYEITSDADNDVITDFNLIQGDRIDLSAIGGLTFVGRNTFSGPGEVRYFKAGGNTFIEINETGAAGAEAVIQLQGSFNLHGSDFFL
jgi:hypothetical protein